ncbi:MAG TPA: hypothetical protein EYO90_07135 [Candidatus Latescibacteria bacterium]|nr:hypothetical protein [Candidatus Latescibacterota bacterium]
MSAGEQCDDGNTNAGDGCSDACNTEAPVLAPALDVPGILFLIVLLMGVGAAVVLKSQGKVV